MIYFFASTAQTDLALQNLLNEQSRGPAPWRPALPRQDLKRLDRYSGSLLNAVIHAHRPVVTLNTIHSLRMKAHPNQNALKGKWQGYCPAAGLGPCTLTSPTLPSCFPGLQECCRFTHYLHVIEGLLKTSALFDSGAHFFLWSPNQIGPEPLPRL